MAKQQKPGDKHAPPDGEGGEETGVNHKDVLKVLCPPKECFVKQNVSMAPALPNDVVKLEKLLDRKLQERRASEVGICPIRRELYSQCFDELIRQVTINCAERGMLLLRIRDEIRMTMAAFQTLYESSIAFALGKMKLAAQVKADKYKKIAELEKQIEDVKKELEEAKLRSDVNETIERLMQENNKLMEQIEFYKNKNSELKTQLVDSGKTKK